MTIARRLAALVVLTGCAGAAPEPSVVLPATSSSTARPSADCAATVDFHGNAALEDAIRRAIGKPVGGVDTAELGAIRRLNVAAPVVVLDRCVFSHLSELRELYIHGGALSDLRPLAPLRALTTLVLRGVAVTDLEPLRGLVAMERLDLSETLIRELGPLADMTSLEELLLTGTAITDLSPLKALRNLRYLDIAHTQTTDTSMIPSPRMRVTK